jgi:hypothetical protein
VPEVLRRNEAHNEASVVPRSPTEARPKKEAPAGDDPEASIFQDGGAAIPVDFDIVTTYYFC